MIYVNAKTFNFIIAHMKNQLRPTAAELTGKTYTPIIDPAYQWQALAILHTNENK